jgi:hypothetical protein
VPTSTVFISYSHRDETWKDRLLTQLGVLKQQELLELWHDRRIGAGADWYEEIRQAIEAAHVAVLLISADFLTSPFILQEYVCVMPQRQRARQSPLQSGRTKGAVVPHASLSPGLAPSLMPFRGLPCMLSEQHQCGSGIPRPGL